MMWNHVLTGHKLGRRLKVSADSSRTTSFILFVLGSCFQNSASTSFKLWINVCSQMQISEIYCAVQVFSWVCVIFFIIVLLAYYTQTKIGLFWPSVKHNKRRFYLKIVFMCITICTKRINHSKQLFTFDQITFCVRNISTFKSKNKNTKSYRKINFYLLGKTLSVLFDHVGWNSQKYSNSRKMHVNI